MIVVFRTPDADVLWTGNSEVMFHRHTMMILDPAGVPATKDVSSNLAFFNLPIRFPWVNAQQALTSFTDFSLVGGQGALAVTPTRTLLRLRQGDGVGGNITLAAPGNMRLFYVSTDELKVDQTLLYDPAQPAFLDVTWGTFTAGAGETPTMMLTGEHARLGGDYASLIPTSSDATLQSLFLDVIRYGFL
jgi:hypothetical protein